MGRMKVCLGLFLAASIFNGATWWAHVIAETLPGTHMAVMELIQLGGTGGLILSLLGAVLTLWKERYEIRKSWREEVESLRKMISDERTEHRKELAEIRLLHQQDLTAVSEKYTTELKNQIEMLRQEQIDRTQHEREISDRKYEQGK